MSRLPIRFAGLLLMMVLTLLALACGLVFGSKTLTFRDLLHYWFSDGLVQNYADLVVAGRIPRTLAAACCGAALGLSGALMQGLTRNPLGDPGLLGVNAGAAAAIVLSASVPWLAGVSEFWLALAGAFVVALLICSIGLGRRTSYARLVLAGAAVAAALQAYVSAASQLNPILFDHFRFWGSGSFGAATLPQVYGMLPFFLPASLAAVALGYHLNLIALGSDTAKALGANVLLIQAAVLTAAAVLAGVAVAVAGPITFVGLGAAHIVRMWTGNDYRWLLPYSFFAGAVLLVLSDVVARTVVAPGEVPTGIITALAGAPLLYLAAMRLPKGRKA
ncbi:iron ABC transporter permease [Uruburuella testudinis]|uniref:Iron ABC transporter permease n=1 Tax=Uruburuella testudinis TaxID=1282863 RepID=A0ABY4DUA1_9NEIS|nr:iron ABC transporter permease [Uruburuella testudinis]UOO82289.1 iron ABC transporter permease [Uruburuella testudinis]